MRNLPRPSHNYYFNVGLAPGADGGRRQMIEMCRWLRRSTVRASRFIETIASLGDKCVRDRLWLSADALARPFASRGWSDDSLRPRTATRPAVHSTHLRGGTVAPLWHGEAMARRWHGGGTSMAHRWHALRRIGSRQPSDFPVVDSDGSSPSIVYRLKSGRGVLLSIWSFSGSPAGQVDDFRVR